MMGVRTREGRSRLFRFFFGGYTPPRGRLRLGSRDRQADPVPPVKSGVWNYHQLNRPARMQYSLFDDQIPESSSAREVGNRNAPVLEERKIVPPRQRNAKLKPFPTHLTPAQRAIVVAVPKRRSKIFHHLQCRRKTKHPSNYDLTTVGEASLLGCRPVSHRAGCCYNELLQLFQ